MYKNLYKKALKQSLHAIMWYLIYNQKIIFISMDAKYVVFNLI